MRRLLALGAGAMLITGCGGGGDGGGAAGDGSGANVDIASGALEGKVGGAAWTLAGARTNAFLSDDDKFWVDMYGQGTVTCGSMGEGNRLIVNVPTKVGAYRLSLNLNSTFVVVGTETDNLVATQGAIRVDEVTATSLRGGLNMTYDANNTVNGVFEATVCAE